MQKLSYEKGIYWIWNIITKDFYIGSAVNFGNRFRRHLYDLRHNQHHSPILQNAYNKYGEENFVLEPIFHISIKIDELELIKYEQKFLDIFNPKYNISKVAGRIQHSKEGKLKIQMAKTKEFIVTFPDGHEEKIRNLKEFCNKNNLDNRLLHAVVKGKQSNHKGYKARYAKEKTNRFKPNPKRFVKCKLTNPEGKIFIIENLRKFCLENKLNPNAFYKCINHKTWKHKGWKCQKM